LVLEKGDIEAGGRIESPFGDCDLVVAGGRLTLTINGLRASTSYKVSIVAKDAGGFTTKAMNATVKTAAVAPIKKIVVNKTMTTVNSVGFRITDGGKVEGGFGTVGGYIVQVYGPKPKGGVQPILKTLYFQGESLKTDKVFNKDLLGFDLLAKTKYTFVVTATTATSEGAALMDDGHLLPGQKLSATKSIAITTKKA
jgi:hypothetical protein